MQSPTMIKSYGSTVTALSPAVWVDYKWETERFSRCPDFQREAAS
jgi:hypothetical protein